MHIGFFGPHQLRRQKFIDEGWTEQAWQKILAAYYGQVSQIDYHIGRIISKLKSLGLHESTMIIFTADHSDHNGQFGLFEKGTMYEGSVRVPLIIKDSATYSSRRTDKIVNTIDFYRTILGRYGLKCSDDIPARDLTPVLSGDDDICNNKTKAFL
jgi:arylsulfatase A-like enzyme